ncbi:Uncharacterised protein [Mycobacteroides abscessus]|uniref:Uncharacterized protein n=1 Tax=Mycobacteroides abscessus subsp. massiliense TaxID=1962118 RepID=A0AB38DJ29_9MYCO|nr:hypothetical protein PROPHIGD68-1_25 [Mycobacterium phage prophi68-1]QSM05046.1 hypothetical protein PROPHIGD04-1_25 [Mycobacterium phage prophiGD04-1]CPR33995.1 Uncharacterised protein [Mycobacteroides abscessus]SKD21044.1 Uncharacterised protein [Mycobacteroides abscessus subsp. massiliense]CPS51514.1 Uncharacterised protein [Mycobacteroides abscessus]
MTVISLPTYKSDELLLREIAERINKTHPFSAIQLRSVAARITKRSEGSR